MSNNDKIGGVSTALLAPQLFNLVYEYPLLITAALLATPGMFAGGAAKFVREAWLPLAFAMIAILAYVLLNLRFPASGEIPFQLALVGHTASMLFQRARPQRFVALVVLAFVLTG